MKKIAALILLTLFILVGCSENSVVEPGNDIYNAEQLPKGRPILNDGDDDKYLDYDKLFYLYDDSTSYGGTIKLDGDNSK